MSSPQSGLPTDPWHQGETPPQPAPHAQPGYEYAQPYANQPTYPVGYAQPVYPPAALPQAVWEPAPSRRSNALVIVLVVLIVLLVGGAGLGYYIYTHNGATTTTTDSSTDPTQFRTGDCLINSGTAQAPQMRKVACGPGTLLILTKIPDTTDTSGCTGIPGATLGYYYTNPKFVLCLQQK